MSIVRDQGWQFDSQRMHHMWLGSVLKKKKEKKLKLLTCVKLIVNIACDLLLVSFIPVLAVTLKVNKIDLKNMFLHVHINCYHSSSGDIVMTNSI